LVQEPKTAESLVSFRQALAVWIRVGLQSFGGPAGQIAVMHRILVEETRWISERRFLHALSYCMLLPGPEAQQLATYLGWLLHGYPGGLVAGVLFVLPGFFAILLLSYLYVTFQGAAILAGLLFGLKAAVLAVVLEALLRIGRRVLVDRVTAVVAAAAFIGIFFFRVPFPGIVLAAALVGLLWSGARARGRRTVAAGARENALGKSAPASASPVVGSESRAGDELAVVDRLLAQSPERARPSWRRALYTATVCSFLWLLPILGLAVLLGPRHVYVLEGVFFSKAAMVTFGGAYAVLAYVAQQAVERYAWLDAAEMVDGLGMAETTPGPLIMVVQFVGFMGAYRNPSSLDPLLAGALGAVLTTWVTFVPCFLWIFLGAPYIESLRENRRLEAALSAITAAVVGVILNLAMWFALHVLFSDHDEIMGPLGLRLLAPRWSTVDVAALSIFLAAVVAMLRFKVGMLATLGGSMLLGIVARLLFV
jgi:chromate transporter